MTLSHVVAPVALMVTSMLSVTAMAQTWSDTHLGFRHGEAHRELANPEEISKEVLSVGHVSGYGYGQNFFNLDILQSDRNDPAQGGATGATEFYLVYRHQVHADKLSHTSWQFGPVRQVAVTLGFDLNSKNTAVAPRKRLAVIGPTLKLDVPGFFDVSLLAAYETGHCGVCTEPTVSYDPFPMLNLAWGMPFDLAGAPLRFQGFANLIAGKGENHSGSDTHTELLTRPALLLDLGHFLLAQDKILWAGMGYEIWRNKFGNEGVMGADTTTVTANVEWHF